MNNFHSPTELTEEVEIAEGGHVRVSPGMDSNVIFTFGRERLVSWQKLRCRTVALTTENLESGLERVGVSEDVDTDEEVRRGNAI